MTLKGIILLKENKNGKEIDFRTTASNVPSLMVTVKGKKRFQMVYTGLENLITSPPDWLKGRRLGLLCNPASVDRAFRHARHLIHERFPGQLTTLFSPQHGFWAAKQDNMIESDHTLDPRTRHTGLQPLRKNPDPHRKNVRCHGCPAH